MDIKNKLFIKFLEEQVLPGSGYRSFKEFVSSPKVRARMRRYWRMHVTSRQVLGLCISCNRRHQLGMQRCGLHRNLNKAKCLAWAKANRQQIRNEYQRRVGAGICTTSPSHGPSFDGHTTCKTCYTRTKKARLTRANYFSK